MKVDLTVPPALVRATLASVMCVMAYFVWSKLSPSPFCSTKKYMRFMIIVTVIAVCILIALALLMALSVSLTCWQDFTEVPVFSNNDVWYVPIENARTHHSSFGYLASNTELIKEFEYLDSRVDEVGECGLNLEGHDVKGRSVPGGDSSQTQNAQPPQSQSRSSGSGARGGRGDQGLRRGSSSASGGGGDGDDEGEKPPRKGEGDRIGGCGGHSHQVIDRNVESPTYKEARNIVATLERHTIGHDRPHEMRFRVLQNEGGISILNPDAESDRAGYQEVLIRVPNIQQNIRRIQELLKSRATDAEIKTTLDKLKHELFFCAVCQDVPTEDLYSPALVFKDCGHTFWDAHIFGLRNCPICRKTRSITIDFPTDFKSAFNLKTMTTQDLQEGITLSESLEVPRQEENAVVKKARSQLPEQGEPPPAGAYLPSDIGDPFEVLDEQPEDDAGLDGRSPWNQGWNNQEVENPTSHLGPELSPPTNRHIGDFDAGLDGGPPWNQGWNNQEVENPTSSLGPELSPPTNRHIGDLPVFQSENNYWAMRSHLPEAAGHRLQLEGAVGGEQEHEEEDSEMDPGHPRDQEDGEESEALDLSRDNENAAEEEAGPGPKYNGKNSVKDSGLE